MSAFPPSTCSETLYHWAEWDGSSYVVVSGNFPTAALAYAFYEDVAAVDRAAWVLRVAMIRPLVPIRHGTPQGYRLEIRRKLTPCGPCSDAFAEYKATLASREHPDAPVGWHAHPETDGD